MPPIQPLSQDLINKIAAGEVVERPASVVKELVENALDAHATRIEIELQEGGKKLILVRDNGEGIAAGEMALAVCRHATSKISSSEDLFRIRTLGFRGEALASIGAVSQFSIVSRKAGLNLAACELTMEGGKILTETETGHAEGTMVKAQYLFHNIPARLKFLKSTETEVSHIEDHIIRLALAHPHVAFKMTHQGKNVLVTRGHGDLISTVEEIFGRETAVSIYPMAWERADLKIHGFVGHPLESTSTSQHFYFFVNGRSVRDKMMHHAVLEAYRDLLMKGRFPFVALFVGLPHAMVDVNVHPAKTEVKFSNSALVHNAVVEAVRGALQGAPWNQNHRQEEVSEPSCLQKRESSAYAGMTSASFPNDNQLFTALKNSIDAPPAKTQQKAIAFGQTPFADLTILGQILGTYIVCQTPGKLVLIDQHAAHERIRFEQLLMQWKEGKIESQRLLIPENFDLRPSEAEILKKCLPELESLGLEIEFFGGVTFVTKSIPALLSGHVRIKDLIMDLVSDVLEKGELTSFRDKTHDIFARMACHSAIRAHDILSMEEMRALVASLDKYHFTSFCPHGRPVSVEVTEYEIEKWFKRVV